eukprot:jgi/Undpi1/10155/HiC_scaffold_28.g12608.m1
MNSPDKTSPAVIHPPGPEPSSATLASTEQRRGCEGSPSHSVERSRGHSWWIYFSGATSHAVRTPAPLSGWRATGGVGVVMILAEEESSNRDHPEYPDSDDGLNTGITTEAIMNSAPAKAGSRPPCCFQFQKTPARAPHRATPPCHAVHTPSPTLASTVRSTRGRWRRCARSHSHPIERPGGRSWWISFNGITSHAADTTVSLSSSLLTGGVSANVTERNTSDDRPASPVNDADKHVRNTDELILYSAAVRAASFLERIRLSAEHDKGSSSSITVCSSGDRSPASTSTGLIAETSIGLDGGSDSLRTGTKSDHLPVLDLVDIESSASSGEDDTSSCPLCNEVSEAAPTPLACAKNLISVDRSHGDSVQRSPVGPISDGGVRSTERQHSALSLATRTSPLLDERHTIQLAVGETVPVVVRRERATGGVGGQQPITGDAAISLDQAIVWPSSTSTHTNVATGMADESQVYGGGQLIGLNGDVILGASPLGM